MATDYHVQRLAELYAKGVVTNNLLLRPKIYEILGANFGRTLDLGCGCGADTEKLDELTSFVVGIDLSRSMLHHAPSGKYIQAHGSALPFADRKFDTILMNMVIPDVPTAKALQQIFREAYRVLVQGGRFVFSGLHPLYLVPGLNSSDCGVNSDPHRYLEAGHTFEGKAKVVGEQTIHFTETHYPLELV